MIESNRSEWFNRWFSKHPEELTWMSLVLFFGGIMIGYGSRAAGGCPSGHSITGMSLLNPPSQRSYQQRVVTSKMGPARSLGKQTSSCWPT